MPQCLICKSPIHPTEEHYERKAKLEKGVTQKENIPEEFKQEFTSTLGYHLFESPKWPAIRRAQEAWEAYTRYMTIMATLQNQAELLEARRKMDKLQEELENALKDVKFSPIVTWEEIEEILAYTEAELRTAFSERLLKRQEKFYEEQRLLNIVENLDIKAKAAWTADNIKLALDLNNEANKVIQDYESKFGLWFRENPTDKTKLAWGEVCGRCGHPGHRQEDALYTKVENGRRRIITVCEELHPPDTLKCAYCGNKGHIWDNCEVRVTPQILVSVTRGTQVSVSINKSENGFVYGVENKILTRRSGVVALEKFRPTTSMFGSLRSALNNVIVLPEPGGPQRSSGLCSARNE